MNPRRPRPELSPEEAARRLVALRRKIGRHWVAYRYPDERRAGLAYKRVADGTLHLVTVWRFHEQSSGLWWVAAIGEEADAVLALELVLSEVDGAERMDALPPGITHDQLRERRWQNMVAAARRVAASGREPGDEVLQSKVHIGGGAVMGRDGSLRPYKRPQG